MCDACSSEREDLLVLCPQCLENMVMEIATEILVRHEVIKITEGFCYKETARDLIQVMIRGGKSNA